jgi:two-component system, sensor histidine kinase RegB
MAYRIPSLLWPDSYARQENRLLRMETLLRLRWLTIFGQGITVLIVQFGLGLMLPLGSIGLVLVLAMALNLVLHQQYRSGQRVEEAAVFVLLVADILQLAALLALTGGMKNPFCILFLAPVLISANALPAKRTIALGLLAMLASTCVAVFHLPMPWFGGGRLILPQTYELAIWVALQVGIVFIGVYAWRIAEEARQLLDALVATEFVLAREKHLSQLDGLAAAAAHQLGTPLATIALVVKEMLNAAKPDDPQRNDLLLLKDQTGRCRDILSRIATLSAETGGPLGRLSVSALIEEAMEPYRAIRDEDVHIFAEGPSPEPVCSRNPGLAYGIGNLIQNALSYARSSIEIEARWNAEEVTIRITDDGPGFPAGALDHLGDPYLSIRPAHAAEVDPDHPSGMGLGLFIAKTLLERSGATLTATNRKAPETGALLIIRWPRHLFEQVLRNEGAESEQPAFSDHRSGDGG